MEVRHQDGRVLPVHRGRPAPQTAAISPILTESPMTPEQKAAYVFSQAACVLAELAAMQLENQLDVKMGHTIHHTPDNFRELIERYGIHHNAVMEWMR